MDAIIRFLQDTGFYLLKRSGTFFRLSETRRAGLFFTEKRPALQLFFIRVHQRFL